MAFDSLTRSRLARFVADCRDLLTEEFDAKLQEFYGIYPHEGRVLGLDKLANLDDERLSVARLLRQRIDHILATDASGGLKEAVKRVLREQAFTMLNRFAALRMAEERGIIVESVGGGLSSKAFRTFSEIAYSGLGDAYARYRTFLHCLFDELAVDLGSLFDRNSPYGLLFPREDVLIKLFDLLDGPDLKPLWREDETTGWIYQYYNDPEERAIMRDPKRGGSAAPRNSRELAVRNQFFTPRYVVEFLTDNTLGRLWYEMRLGETALKERCRYLVRRPSEIFVKRGESAPDPPKQDNLSQEDLLRQPVHVAHRPLKDPREIRLLDPACGSMHFGLYAFDLFTVIYDEAWEIAHGPDDASKSAETFAPFVTFASAFPDKAAFLREVPRLIVERNIHGIDIDPRAAQIAGLSLWLRAQRAWYQAGVKPADRPRITRSNLVCAEPMPGEKELLREFVEQQFSAGERPAFAFLLEKIFDRMALAGEAGSLLRIEEEIRAAIAEARALAQSQSAPRQTALWAGDERPAQAEFDLRGLNDEQFWQRAEQGIYDALEAYAEQSEDGSGFQRRLFADDAAQGFAFVDLCRKRYDVVVMNPPFGEAAKSSKAYIEASYKYSSNDILHAFVERGLQWLKLSGREGVISARTGFFLGDSKHWRKNVVFRNHLSCFADLGLGVLDDALVEVAAYAIERGSSRGGFVFTNRQLDTREKETGLLNAIQAVVAGEESARASFDQSLLDIIPDYTFAYWAPATFLKRYGVEGRFKEAVASVRQGVATADDFRFARLGWEVPNKQIGRGHVWQRFSKGGEYSPPYDDIHLLVNWENDAAELWNNLNEKGGVRSNIWMLRETISRLFFQPGVTYTVRTASAFAPKVLPSDCIFSHNAQSWFPKTREEMLLSIGYMSCRVPQAFLELAVGSGDIATAGSAARRYTTAVVESVPAGVLLSLQTSANLDAVSSLYLLRVAEFSSDEASCHFSKFHVTSECNLRTGAEMSARAFVSSAVQALKQSAFLDQNVTEAFALTEGESAFVNQEVGIHPYSYNGSAESFEAARLFHLDEEKLMAEAVARHGSKRWFTKKSYFVDRRIEIICHLLSIPPDRLESLLNEHPLSIGVDMFAKSCVSEALGFAFGRWDIRYATGERPAPELPDPFAPLPVCPPGMLQGEDGLPLSPDAGRQLRAEGRYPFDVAWDGILVDDPEHPLDLERRARAALAVLWGDRADALEQEACAVLGVPSVREWFRRPAGFFADHLKRYSKSRRQAPIYWPLSTASGSYSLWIYYHRLTDQTLFQCVNDFVRPKISSVEGDLARAMTATGDERFKRAEIERLTASRSELVEFQNELLRVARLPYMPNLNDGVLITASPLWKLFRLPKWQRDLKACWQELEKGEYDWAHMTYTIWPDRVKKACEQDRSIAIAHGLERLCKVEVREKKPGRGLPKNNSAEPLI